MKHTDHKKKMIAPVIITILFVAYLAAYGILLAKTTDLGPYMILFAIPLVALGGGMVYILITRIKEIRSGEEDDLSNY